MTVETHIQTYLRTLHTGLSDRTQTAYRQGLNLFRTYLIEEDLRPLPLDDLTADVLLGFLNYLQENYSVETEHLYSRAVLHFMRYVEKRAGNDLHAADLAAQLDAARRPKQHHEPNLPLDILDTILDYATMVALPTQSSTDPSRDDLRQFRDKAYILMLADTGLRVSEMSRLRVRDFSPDDEQLVLPDRTRLPLSSTTTRVASSYLTLRSKLDSDQTLPPEDLPLFARHDKRAGSKVLAISRWTGNNIVNEWVDSALNADQKRRLREEDISISPQTFRHYFVLTTLLETGDLDTTGALARHADQSTTRRYLPIAKRLKNDETGA
ncbi:MAG: tyrosine-type recombinase/integrase [Anaerolineae bacterium]